MKKAFRVIAGCIFLTLLPLATVSGDEYPIMRPDLETWLEWQEPADNAPRAYIEPGKKISRGSLIRWFTLDTVFEVPSRSLDSGDYNGDGTSDIAIFRPSSGLWSARGVTRVYFGGSSDIPIPGDYNGDGTTDIGIYRGGSGLWAVRNVTRAYFWFIRRHRRPRRL